MTLVTEDIFYPYVLLYYHFTYTHIIIILNFELDQNVDPDLDPNLLTL